MELEARSFKKNVKAKVVVKLGEYGNDVKKLKAELAKLRSCSATQATVGNIRTMQVYLSISDEQTRTSDTPMKVLLLRCECCLLDVMMKQGYSDQRGRLVTSIDSVKKSSDSIGECREDMRKSGLAAIMFIRRSLHGYLLQGNTNVCSSC